MRLENLRGTEMQSHPHIQQHRIANIGPTKFQEGTASQPGSIDTSNTSADIHVSTPMQIVTASSTKATGLRPNGADLRIDLPLISPLTTQPPLAASSLSRQMRLQADVPFEEVSLDMLSIISPSNRIGNINAASSLSQHIVGTSFLEPYRSAGNLLTKKQQQSRAAGGCVGAAGASLTEALDKPTRLPGEYDGLLQSSIASPQLHSRNPLILSNNRFNFEDKYSSNFEMGRLTRAEQQNINGYVQRALAAVKPPNIQLSPVDLRHLADQIKDGIQRGRQVSHLRLMNPTETEEMMDYVSKQIEEQTEEHRRIALSEHVSSGQGFTFGGSTTPAGGAGGVIASAYSSGYSTQSSSSAQPGLVNQPTSSFTEPLRPIISATSWSSEEYDEMANVIANIRHEFEAVGQAIPLAQIKTIQVKMVTRLQEHRQKNRQPQLDIKGVKGLKNAIALSFLEKPSGKKSEPNASQPVPNAATAAQVLRTQFLASLPEPNAELAQQAKELLDFFGVKVRSCL